MEELYEIMRDLLEIEYHQDSLLHMLELIESSLDSEEQNETKRLTNGIKFFLTSLLDEMKSAVNKMDNYILREKINQNKQEK